MNDVDLVNELKKIVQDSKRVTNQSSMIEQHSHDLTYHKPSPPDVIVFPKAKKEVQDVVLFANRHRIPIVPFGVGSSLEGHIIPLRGGISLDMSQMNEIVEIRPQDFTVTVQPGVTREQLNKKLKPYGLFFPVDPGANASIGGMVATNASGTNAVRYGSMKHQVLGLEVVLPDGSLIKTGGPYVKSSAGYHLSDLFIGSEGTLGVFTEITLKLYGIPEKDVSAIAVFSDIQSASEAAVQMMSAGLSIGKVELVDEYTIAAVNAYKGTDYIEKPTLFLELSGRKHWVEEDVKAVESISEDAGCISFLAETDSLKKALLWEARHQAAFAILAKYPGKKQMVTDVCVPLSVLPEAIVRAREIVARHDVEGVIFGHVGDGNYHVVFTVDPNRDDEIRKAKNINDDIVRFALKHGGTCTGEHGIGLGKIQYLEEELGGAYRLMKIVKRSIDPHNLFNPGKLFPIE